MSMVVNNSISALSYLKYTKVDDPIMKKSSYNASSGKSTLTSLQLPKDIVTLSNEASQMSSYTSMVRQADGAASNIGDMLQRMKSLAEASQSKNVTDVERSSMNSEFNDLRNEINTVATNKSAYGRSLLDGSTQIADILPGLDKSLTMPLSDLTAKGLGMSQLNITSAGDAKAAADTVSNAIDQVTKQRADFGKTLGYAQYRADDALAQMAADTASSMASPDMVDADPAAGRTHFTVSEVKTQAAIAVLSQANQMPPELMKLLR